MQTSNIIKYIGGRIKHFRQLRGMTREESAAAVGLSSRTLASYERGEREMELKTLLALSSLYNVTVTKLTEVKKIGQVLNG